MPPEVQAQGRRIVPKHEQRLMFEATTHWGRGLAIVLAMIGTVLIFLVILTVLPKPGSSNPLEAITSSNSVQGTPALVGGAADRPAAPAVTAAVLATVAPSTVGPGATGTPGARWTAVATGNTPYVRSAPSTNNNPVSSLAPGRSVDVIGRSPDNAWLQIIWDNNQKAWVARDLMQITTGDVSQIPIVR